MADCWPRRYRSGYPAGRCPGEKRQPHLQIIPFTPTHQTDARNLILQGLGEHWGWIDEQINTDLEDISRSYSAGHFVLGFLDEVLVAPGALIPETETSMRIVRMSVDRELSETGDCNRDSGPSDPLGPEIRREIIGFGNDR